MRILLAVVVLCAFLGGGSGHQMKIGSCRNVDPMQDFDPKKFQGKWYVLEKLVTSSECLLATFNQTSDDAFIIQELRTPLLSQSLPLDITVTNEGRLQMDPNDKAKMTIKWDGNFLSRALKTTFTIVDTDYDNYAMDVECQSVYFFHRVSASIYSRTPTLAPEKLQELRTKLETDYGIDLSRMNTIDQSNCLSLDDNDFNIKLDENGLSLLGLLGHDEIKKLDTEEEVVEFLNKPSST